MPNEQQAIATVGVIGAGQMGAGIAQVFALSGFTVRLNDIAPQGLDRGLATIAASLGRQVEREKIAAGERAEALARISADTGLEALSGCDLVIEAATEDEATKTEIFARLAGHLAPEAILATNTSSIAITRLAAASGRPERFLGLHFMNPVPAMLLVELIRGHATADEVFAAMRAVVARLDKTAVLSADSPAFIVNRMLIPMINEAAFALYEGVGTIADIDTALTLGAGHPMGPLQLADLIGLDTVLAIMTVLADEFGDPKYRPCPLIRRFVEAGWLGRKSGRGFYDYGDGTPRPVR